MAISFVAASPIVTGTAVTVAIPTGYAAGDLLVLIIIQDTTTPATPTGYTRANATTNSPRITTFYKIAGASESSVVTTSSAATATMLAYRGVNATPIDIIGTATTNISSITTASQTTTKANDFVISFYAATQNVLATWTAPSSTTTRINQGATSTIRGLLIVDELKATAGATTTRTATISSSTPNLVATTLSISPSIISTTNNNFFLMF
jgi:hypothetical protein